MRLRPERICDVSAQHASMTAPAVPEMLVERSDAGVVTLTSRSRSSQRSAAPLSERE